MQRVVVYAEKQQGPRGHQRSLPGHPSVVAILLCVLLEFRDFAVRAMAQRVQLVLAIQKMRDPRLMLALLEILSCSSSLDFTLERETLN